MVIILCNPFRLPSSPSPHALRSNMVSTTTTNPTIESPSGGYMSEDGDPAEMDTTGEDPATPASVKSPSSHDQHHISPIDPTGQTTLPSSSSPPLQVNLSSSSTNTSNTHNNVINSSSHEGADTSLVSVQDNSLLDV